jgi:ankyrin repeat protein
MQLPNTRTLLPNAVALLALLAATGMAPEHDALSPVSADEFVRAIATHRTSLIDLYFDKGLNPNARAGQDRPLLLGAVLEQDWKTADRLLKAGASVDLGDETGMKPLMAAAMHGKIDVLNQFIGLATDVAAADLTGRTALHYAVAAGKTAAAEVLLPLVPNLMKPCTDGRDLLAIALETGNWKIIEAILQRLPPETQWSAGARRAFQAALAGGNKDQVRLLLAKHVVPPTPEGRNVPLLAYAIASNDISLFTTLLACGADPNTVLPDKCDKEFLASLPSKSLQNYIPYDKGVTVLMLAAGLGKTDCLQALLDAGADKNRATKRCKMLALYLAAQNNEWRSTQVLLGSGPPPEQLRIEISLASQKAAVIRDGVAVFNTTCSTGRSGYSTRTGDYVITDKDRSHRSTIYKVEMPYFMRLSCLDFGMHEGVVPNYPASHGCIRLPSEAARKLFAEIPVGTLVTVK